MEVVFVELNAICVIILVVINNGSWNKEKNLVLVEQGCQAELLYYLNEGELDCSSKVNFVHECTKHFTETTSY